MRSIIIRATALATLTLASCGIPPRTPVLPPFGGFYNDTTSPVDTTFESTSIGPKEGRSVAINILSLVSFGDASVGTAARMGGIDTVDQIDCRIFNVLGIYQRYETIVTGR